MIRALAAAAVLAAASPALAQLSPAVGMSLGPSPRWGTVEVGVQRYRPNIDSDFTAKPGPYEKVFGTADAWMLQVGIYKAISTRLGSLEVGFRSGWFQDTGHGLTEATLEPSAEETKLKIVPTGVALLYRFDWPVERHGIPLAPYGRVTLERYNWWVTDGGGNRVEKGATHGWTATGGIAFLLDVIDPTLAREFDRDNGVNHTYLYFEVTKAVIDDFGSKTSWDLSPESLALAGGLTFVF